MAAPLRLNALSAVAWPSSNLSTLRATGNAKVGTALGLTSRGTLYADAPKDAGQGGLGLLGLSLRHHRAMMVHRSRGSPAHRCRRARHRLIWMHIDVSSGLREPHSALPLLLKGFIMFPRQTVFVVGAGASCDLNLPTGDQLRDILVRLLARDGNNLRFNNEHLTTAMHKIAQQQADHSWVSVFERYADAAQQICDGLPLAISIDNYLHAHRHDDAVRQVGKLAIATAILDAERNSSLNVKPLPSQGGVDRFSLNEDISKKSWYLPLIRLLTSGKSVNDLPTIFANVAFIVFNYDRCLEHFLINSIMTYFNVSPQQAIDAFSQLTIIHPYGRVGYLGWQGQPLVAEFGDPSSDLMRIAAGIQTFTESADSGVVQSVKELVEQAETLIFLGFGFLDQNMQLLSVESSRVRRVFATIHGISDSDVPIVREAICSITRKWDCKHDAIDEKDARYVRIFTERKFCRDLMENHRFRLSKAPPPIDDNLL